jgi:hypothetical protein
VSDPTDIKALDEYLKGDSDVSRRYRELGRDEVPLELDRRVLTAARDAVANEGTQRSRSWLRWSAPVALAASIVLVVTVVLERGPQDELATVPATQAPAESQQRQSVRYKPDDNSAVERKLANEVTRQRAGNLQEPTPVYVQPVPDQAADALHEMPPLPAPAAVTAAKAEARPVVPPPELAVEQQSEQAVASVAAESQAPAVAASAPAVRGEISARESAALSKEEADAASDVQEISITGARSGRGPGRTAGPRGTISSPGSFASDTRPASDDERADKADRADPEAWLEEIRELRRAGKTADADREWARFHAAFPDFHVADDDIARKKR